MKPADAVPLRIVPVFQSAAKAFVGQFHRHNIPSIASVFNVGLASGDELVGVAVVGIPKARRIMDGRTLEITRVCVRDGFPNANSMLYGACARVAFALGWQRLVTYTLTEECGASLRAAGWVRDAESIQPNVENWHRSGQSAKLAVDLFGRERIPSSPKYRWFRYANTGKSHQPTDPAVPCHRLREAGQ